MKVVITGSSSGIGLAVAKKFINRVHTVHGIDVLPASFEHPNYIHHVADVSSKDLPIIEDVDILINNAGVQNSGRDIAINLQGVINCTELYGMHPKIKSIINMASVSAHNGAEFPEYVASKGGVLAYTINTARRIAKWGATCNSISAGGVLTELNLPIINDKVKWAAVMEETPLKKWATAEEIAEWTYFLAVYNESMSGQDLIIDNLETYNHKFIW